jgi:hypothetical protein
MLSCKCAEWCFIATSHGKDVCGGIHYTLKHLAFLLFISKMGWGYISVEPWPPPGTLYISKKINDHCEALMESYWQEKTKHVTLPLFPLQILYESKRWPQWEEAPCWLLVPVKHLVTKKTLQRLYNGVILVPAEFFTFLKRWESDMKFRFIRR